MRQRLAAYAVVADAVGRVLLTRHRPGRPGRWLLPGGGVEAGQHPEQAVVREVLEEAGLAVAVIGPPFAVPTAVTAAPPAAHGRADLPGAAGGSRRGLRARPARRAGRPGAPRRGRAVVLAARVAGAAGGGIHRVRPGAAGRRGAAGRLTGAPRGLTWPAAPGD